MSRAKKKAKAPVARAKPARPPRGWRAAQPFFASVGTLTVAAAVLMGLNRLGREASLRVGERGRYETRLADVDCPTPPFMDRVRFLSEVQRAGGLPDTFQLLDAALPDRLRAAFGRHPWVERVEAVHVEPGATVRVALKFRTPVLAVPLSGPPWGFRMADSSGVLLPAGVVPARLPELISAVPSPRSSDGEPWGDETVKRAVELVNAYQPRYLEKTSKGWRLAQPDGRLLLVGW